MKPALFLALPMMLAGCASTAPEQGSGQPDGTVASFDPSQSGGCVLRSTINAVETLDDRRVVLFSAGKQKAYMADLEGNCFNLEDQSGFVAYDGDGDSQICGSGRDAIIYRRLNDKIDCRILALVELSDERRVELGVAAPEQESRE